MNIGFDAKRAYHNGTGLGHYSRTLITQLSESFPEHEYYLFNPKYSSRYQLKAPNIHEIRPNRFPYTIFTSAWRSRAVTKDLKKLKKQISESEKEIAKIESSISHIEFKLSKPEALSENESKEIYALYDKYKQQLEEEMNKWSQLSQSLEQLTVS